MRVLLRNGGEGGRGGHWPVSREGKKRWGLRDIKCVLCRGGERVSRFDGPSAFTTDLSLPSIVALRCVFLFSDFLRAWSLPHVNAGPLLFSEKIRKEGKIGKICLAIHFPFRHLLSRLVWKSGSRSRFFMFPIAHFFYYCPKGILLPTAQNRRSSSPSSLLLRVRRVSGKKIEITFGSRYR